MNIFLKYIKRSMFDNKGNLILLIFAISISSALFLSSMGMVDMFLVSYEKPYVESTEDHQLMIQSSEATQFFDLEGIQDQSLKKITPGILLPSVTEDNIRVNLNGRQVEDQNYGELLDKEVIVSKRTLVVHNLEVGDEITIYLAGQEQKLRIVGSAFNEGLFYNDTDEVFSVMASYDYLTRLIDVPSGQYNVVMAKVSGDVEAAKKAFNNDNTKFKSELLYDISAIEQNINDQKNIFYMMLSIVVLMSSVIIYGTFKLIITKRLPVIGTFYSQGASKGQVKRILLGESFLYGLASGILGSSLGAGILFILHRVMAPLKDYDIFEPFQFDYGLIPITLAFSIGLSLISSLIPIIRTNKYQVKNLILNLQEEKIEKHYIKGLIGFGILVIVVILTLFTKDFSMNFSPILLMISLIGLLLTYPLAMDLVIKPIHLLLKKKFGIIALPLKHVSEPGPLKSNITILVIVMLSIIMIVSLGNGLEETVFEAYENLNFDILIHDVPIVDQNMKDKLMDEINSSSEVIGEETQEDYTAYGKIGENSILVSGIDPFLFGEFNGYISFMDESGDDLLETLRNVESNNTLITIKTANRLNLKVGDEIAFSMNGFDKTYNISGIIEGKLYNGGDLMFINNKEMTEIYNIHSSAIYLKTTGSQEAAEKALEPIIKAYGGKVLTFEEMRTDNIEQNAMMVKILSGFSMVAAVIGAFGALNNMFISYIQRKKTLAILNAVGLSQGKRGIMLLKESILSFSIASIVVIPYGYLMMALLSKMTHLIGFPLDLSIKLSVVGPFFLVCGLLYILATLPLMITNRKLSVVKEIRT